MFLLKLQEDNNYCQSSTSQRMVVVKDERDPEVHNKDSVLPEKIKYPHGMLCLTVWQTTERQRQTDRQTDRHTDR